MNFLNRLKIKQLKKSLERYDWQGIFLALTFLIISGIMIVMAGIINTVVSIIFHYTLIYYVIKYSEFGEGDE